MRTVVSHIVPLILILGYRAIPGQVRHAAASRYLALRGIPGPALSSSGRALAAVRGGMNGWTAISVFGSIGEWTTGDGFSP